MIVLRAIPFSVAILWRYLLVFPFLIIAFFFFGLLAVFLVVIFGFVSPLLGLLIAMAFSMAFSIVPAMVGTRLGLQAKQVKPRIGYFGMLVPALGYGLLEGVFMLFLIVLGMAVFAFLTPIDIVALFQLGVLESADVFEQLMTTNPQLATSLTVIGTLAVFALRAALLVPLTGASVGEDFNGRRHTPFYGMGRGMYQNLILVILSYMASALVVPFVFYLLLQMGYGDLVEETTLKLSQISEVEDFLEIWQELAIFAVMCLFFYLWAFSLQCAGGVLVYMQNLGRGPKERLLTEPTLERALNESLDEVDLKALRRSRMPSQDR